MDVELNTKAAARSKHFHSLHKDKNKYKKKSKHLANLKPRGPTQDNNEPEDEEEIEEEGEEGTTKDAPKPPKQRSRFSRRTIESNDFRYQEEEEKPEEDEAAYPSMHSLLEAANSGARSSQFRFQGEKEWDDDEDNNTITAATNKQQPTGSKLDCEALGRILHSLPLHKQLQLDESLLPPDLLAQITIPQHSKSTSKQNTPQALPTTKATTIITRVSSEPAKPNTPTTTATPTTDDKVLDELLKLETPSTSNQPKEGEKEQLNPTTAKTEELEDWLESVI
jgi:hypothetical protein